MKKSPPGPLGIFWVGPLATPTTVVLTATTIKFGKNSICIVCNYCDELKRFIIRPGSSETIFFLLLLSI